MSICGWASPLCSWLGAVRIGDGVDAARDGGLWWLMVRGVGLWC